MKIFDMCTASVTTGGQGVRRTREYPRETCVSSGIGYSAWRGHWRSALSDSIFTCIVGDGELLGIVRRRTTPNTKEATRVHRVGYEGLREWFEFERFAASFVVTPAMFGSAGSRFLDTPRSQQQTLPASRCVRGRGNRALTVFHRTAATRPNHEMVHYSTFAILA